MADKEGLKFTMPDGLTLQVLTNGPEATHVSLGEGMLSIFERDDGYDVSMKQSISRNAEQAVMLAQVKVEVVKIKDQDLYSAKVTGSTEPLRTCSVCNGKHYCVTNGCVNIGCGWLCD
jgi:hypothetical protein